MAERVLFVDDDRAILTAYRRQLSRRFDMVLAGSGTEALEQLAISGPFAVIVSDMRMPGMDGVQLLEEMRRRAPETIRIMLTGNSEQKTAAQAVNQGQVFRFLNKPCMPEALAEAIEAGLALHALKVSERELLEKTLNGSLRVMMETLALVNPVAFGRGMRIRRFVEAMDEGATTPDGWIFETAAFLSQLGCLTLPAALLEKAYRGQPLGDAETAAYAAYPRDSARLLAHIPRLEPLVAILTDEPLALDSAPGPAAPATAAPRVPDPAVVAAGRARLDLALALDERLLRGAGFAQALNDLRATGRHDGRLIDALTSHALRAEGDEIRPTRIADLAPGTLLEEDILSQAGVLLVARGQEITWAVIALLRNYALHSPVREPFLVRIRAGHPSTASPASSEAPRAAA